MKYLVLAAKLVMFAAIWLAFLAIWIALSFLMSDKFLTDLPSRPFFSGHWRTSDGMLAFSGQIDFAGAMLGGAFTFFLALLFMVIVLQPRFTPARRAIPDEWGGRG